MKDKYKKIKS